MTFSIVQGILDIHAVSKAELLVDSELVYPVRLRYNQITLNWWRQQTPPETLCMISVRQTVGTVRQTEGTVRQTAGTVLIKNRLFRTFRETYCISHFSINLPGFRDRWLVTIRPRAKKFMYLLIYVLTRNTKLIYTQNLQELLTF